MIPRTYNEVSAQLARVAGMTGMRVDDDRLLEAVNLAQEKLDPLGDWIGKVARLRFDITDRTFALPIEYEAVLHAVLDDRPVPVLNRWFEFISVGPGPQDDYTTSTDIYDRGSSPVWTQPNGRYVRALSLGSEVSGSGSASPPEITLYGTDEDGFPLRTEESDGSITDGVRLQLVGHESPNYQDTTIKIGTITSVKKPATLHPVELYWKDDDDVLTLGARYWHWVRNPMFRIYDVPSASEDGSTLRVLAKRRFLPIRSDALDTPMYITSIPALRQALMAIRKEDEGDFLKAEALLQLAVKTLTKEKEDHERALRPVVEPSHSRIVGFGNVPHVV